MQLVVQEGLVIPAAELEVRRSRSSGPGGQNVNKTSTRVELRFDVLGSSVLDAAQKERIRKRLATRMNREGYLRVVAQAARTQKQNEAAARARLAALLRQALHLPRARRATHPTAASEKHRLDAKRRRAQLKRERRVRPPHDE